MLGQNQAKRIKIVVTGGGSGGHVMPIVAVIEQLRRLSTPDILWVGEKKSLEEKLAKDLKVNFAPILGGKWRRYLSITNFCANLRDTLYVLIGFFQSIIIILKFKPDAIFSKAGYVAVPLIIAAKICGVKVIAHESDTVIGAANRLSLKLKQTVCVGWPTGYYPQKYRSLLYYSGNPIREYPKIKNFDLARKSLLLEKGDVMFVVGGSQGATFINELIWDNLKPLLKDVQIVHQVGKNNYEKAKQIKQKLAPNLAARYHIYDFLDTVTLAQVLSLTDAVVSRSGANSIADFAYFGVPAILIPLPTSAGNHQFVNAKICEKIGGAVLLEQDKINRGQFVPFIESFILDKKQLKVLAEKIRTVNPSDADEKIAHYLLRES